MQSAESKEVLFMVSTRKGETVQRESTCVEEITITVNIVCVNVRSNPAEQVHIDQNCARWHMGILLDLLR